ncbi:N-acetylneuraminate lyase [Helcococcus ovis]|uniref:N-acetylneuraminate lyase n=1 Tax=Helcococcus ovis TaxID=72026 RepID=A0A4R9C064_9FIRM|nr:N-acetylneuraminate lyase [Helcococcus ovis]TFF64081.1 N-acetylneuraminate lyase [Helcococcus ovis]TFF64986.1 N-acetylneuraminate lyase [Helcococcus ovis]
MLREDLKGLYSALLVPFNEDGSVNEEGLRKIIRHNIDRMNIDGLYVGGSSGENFLLGKEEKKQIFEIAKDEAKDQIKLIAQIGSSNIYEAIELGKFVTDLAYDAISAVTPFYYRFNADEVYNYYKEITENVENDLIIYSIPLLTGVDMGIKDFERLFKLPRIVGVKYTSADFYLLERLRKTFKQQLIFSGFDEMLVPAVANNVDGAIGSTYNVNGIRSRQIFDAVKSNDLQKALEIQNLTNDFISAVLNNGLYQTLKYILQREVKSDKQFYSRKPMAQITEEQKQEAENIYQKFIK